MAPEGNARRVFVDTSISTAPESLTAERTKASNPSGSAKPTRASRAPKSRPQKGQPEFTCTCNESSSLHRFRIRLSGVRDPNYLEAWCVVAYKIASTPPTSPRAIQARNTLTMLFRKHDSNSDARTSST
jgi:hypothetical protein